MRIIPAGAIALLGLPAAAWAHGGEHAGAWYSSSRALVLGNLLGLSLVYLLGYRRLGARSRKHTALRWRLVCFLSAIASLLVALVSPMDTLAEKLGWVHMIQHTTLMMVAAPLFIVGNPGGVMLWALSPSWRGRFWRAARTFRRWRLPNYTVTQPILIWLLFAVTLWIWHLPALYEGALQSRLLHDLQHLTFFLSACFFWQALLHPLRRRRLDHGVGVLYLFLTSIHSTALGAAMAFSPVVWYPSYEKTAPALGYSALQDQQIAGYIMWMPACMMYSAIAVALAASWLMGMRDRGPVRMGSHVHGM